MLREFQPVPNTVFPASTRSLLFQFHCQRVLLACVCSFALMGVGSLSRREDVSLARCHSPCGTRKRVKVSLWQTPLPPPAMRPETCSSRWRSRRESRLVSLYKLNGRILATSQRCRDGFRPLFSGHYSVHCNHKRKLC